MLCFRWFETKLTRSSNSFAIGFARCGFAKSQRLTALSSYDGPYGPSGSRYQRRFLLDLEFELFRWGQGDPDRILKLIVYLYCQFYSKLHAKIILKFSTTKFISNVLYYPRSMVNEYCLIRCGSCGESKSIFRPWNPNKYLCMDCFNFYGPVAQLDKASVYGTEEYRFESYRVRQN